jgi:general stress protein YciG
VEPSRHPRKSLIPGNLGKEIEVALRRRPETYGRAPHVLSEVPLQQTLTPPFVAYALQPESWRAFSGHKARDGEAEVAKEDRGFASMDRSKQREIASKGGKAAHQKGSAHEWTSEEAREAGRKGGMASHRRKQRARDSGESTSPATENRGTEGGGDQGGGPPGDPTRDDLQY